ncbi:hypothetical protein LCGC14_0766700 [marine sediment metagenome]
MLTFGATALANLKTDVKVDGIEMGIVLVNGTSSASITPQIKASTENTIVRLYKFQNARIVKALEFTTKKTNPKLA